MRPIYEYLGPRYDSPIGHRKPTKEEIKKAEQANRRREKEAMIEANIAEREGFREICSKERLQGFPTYPF